MVVSTTQLAKQLSAESHIPFTKAMILVSGIFSMISSELAKGNDIKSRNNFTLKVVQYQPKTVGDISANSIIVRERPAVKRVKFKPSILLKEELNKL